LDTGGTIAFISRLDVVIGANDCKLAATVATGSRTVGALFGTETGKVSEASVAEGAGGKVDGIFNGGKDVDVTLGELELAGTKDVGNSGKCEDPEGKEGLKLGYCICCCIDEGIDNPGGGRSKDCWCRWGSPFGAL